MRSLDDRALVVRGHDDRDRRLEEVVRVVFLDPRLEVVQVAEPQQDDVSRDDDDEEEQQHA